MRLVVALKLVPSNEQRRLLRQTLEQANAAANHISGVAWRERTFGQFKLQKLVYGETRQRFGLTAQVVIRLIAKVADAYTLDRGRERRFRAVGSIAYDDRILRYGSEYVSIWTVGGRQAIPFVCGERQRELLKFRQGESDLVLRDGDWYLLASVNVIEPPTGQVEDYLGVDLGIKNIAADSDATLYAGGHVNGLRHRQRRLRQRLQSKGTRSAQRLLKRRRRTEHRFGTCTNHTISKRIVAEAQCTKRGIALEDLAGIRTRIKARRSSQRATLHAWSFHQLGQFVAYKAALAGVPVVYVDPRNTSRTCPGCGLVDKANRRTQAQFVCVGCRLAGLADHFAALIIRDRGRAGCHAAGRGGCGISVSKHLAASSRALARSP